MCIIHFVKFLAQKLFLELLYGVLFVAAIITIAAFTILYKKMIYSTSVGCVNFVDLRINLPCSVWFLHSLLLDWTTAIQ